MSEPISVTPQGIQESEYTFFSKNWRNRGNFKENFLELKKQVNVNFHRKNMDDLSRIEFKKKLDIIRKKCYSYILGIN